ncbi:hypothetical protein FQZ97_764510 [compost metagenome]
MADQPVRGIAEHVVQRRVRLADAVEQVDFEVAVADRVEHRLPTVLAARQAFEHAVELTGQLAYLVVAAVAQVRQRRLGADAGDFAVQLLHAAQHPELQAEVTQRQRDHSGQRRQHEEEADRLLASRIEVPGLADPQAHFRLALAVEHAQVDCLLLMRVELARRDMEIGGAQILVPRDQRPVQIIATRR